jgi:hypothetical protein
MMRLCNSTPPLQIAHDLLMMDVHLRKNYAILPVCVKKPLHLEICPLARFLYGYRTTLFRGGSAFSEMVPLYSKRISPALRL